ncbi:hypothetical protein DUNSADRAFT_16671 [Dunaliella salina]|uniref:Encoded protein n=1 Tax=Dunaliella salina TaxID=3046 RepID=A0ABQ7H0S0_DUNSA|nr:hypothetical protein DUNSADRAFT_16671 [Dunaliella salina]|eukprot:KAF5840437.1 hypothetical protein DUNSADRAFT_16671 [Dunaliella salina]
MPARFRSTKVSRQGMFTLAPSQCWPWHGSPLCEQISSWVVHSYGIDVGQEPYLSRSVAPGIDLVSFALEGLVSHLRDTYITLPTHPLPGISDVLAFFCTPVHKFFSLLCLELPHVPLIPRPPFFPLF